MKDRKKNQEYSIHQLLILTLLSLKASIASEAQSKKAFTKKCEVNQLRHNLNEVISFQLLLSGSRPRRLLA